MTSVASLEEFSFPERGVDMADGRVAEGNPNHCLLLFVSVIYTVSANAGSLDAAMGHQTTAVASRYLAQRPTTQAQQPHVGYPKRKSAQHTLPRGRTRLTQDLRSDKTQDLL